MEGVWTLGESYMTVAFIQKGDRFLRWRQVPSMARGEGESIPDEQFVGTKTRASSGVSVVRQKPVYMRL